jgi:O-antigen/teichoic acid export membrane protein
MALVRRMRRYLATNTSAVALGGAIQGLDKVIVSALVPLDVVGRYMFISQICLIVVKLVTPNVTAVFPRLTAYVHTHDRANARSLYFAASQMTSAFVATFAVGATFFGAEMLFTLTGDRDFALRYQTFFSVLAWGYSLYSLGLLPNALQQVEGHPETLFWNNLIGALLYLPLVVVATPIYGIIAPAFLWLALTAAWLAIFAWRAHRHFLAGMAWPWIRSSLLAQIIPVAVTLTVAKMMIRDDLTVAALAQTIAAGTLACVLAVLASPDLRGAIVDASRRLPFRRLLLNGSRSDVRA